MNTKLGTPNAAPARADRLPANPRRRRIGATLGSIIASSIMALMVAGAAMALERTPDATCLEANSTPCESEQIEWCKPWNGRMICIGEPN
jgi:hypothetical protein